MDQSAALAKLKYYERTELKHHRDYIRAHNNCVLCGTALELQHIAEAQENNIKEEAYCPHCDTRTRAKIHTLN